MSNIDLITRSIFESGTKDNLNTKYLVNCNTEFIDNIKNEMNKHTVLYSKGSDENLNSNLRFVFVNGLSVEFNIDEEYNIPIIICKHEIL